MQLGECVAISSEINKKNAADSLHRILLEAPIYGIWFVTNVLGCWTFAIKPAMQSVTLIDCYSQTATRKRLRCSHSKLRGDLLELKFSAAFCGGQAINELVEVLWVVLGGVVRNNKAFGEESATVLRGEQ